MPLKNKPNKQLIQTGNSENRSQSEHWIRFSYIVASGLLRLTRTGLCKS